jgi:hypothetical protein
MSRREKVELALVYAATLSALLLVWVVSPSYSTGLFGP